MILCMHVWVKHVHCVLVCAMQCGLTLLCSPVCSSTSPSDWCGGSHWGWQVISDAGSVPHGWARGSDGGWWGAHHCTGTAWREAEDLHHSTGQAGYCYLLCIPWPILPQQTFALYISSGPCALQWQCEVQPGPISGAQRWGGLDEPWAGMVKVCACDSHVT